MSSSPSLKICSGWCQPQIIEYGGSDAIIPLSVVCNRSCIYYLVILDHFLSEWSLLRYNFLWFKFNSGRCSNFKERHLQVFGDIPCWSQPLSHPHSGIRNVSKEASWYSTFPSHWCVSIRNKSFPLCLVLIPDVENEWS